MRSIVPRPDNGFTAIVLAAQRASRTDPLAEAAGISHKCLVRIADKPLIAHVVAALKAAPGLGLLRIVVEPEMFAEIEAALPSALLPVEFVAAAPNLADSVFAGAGGIDHKMLVTTADNVLLTPAAVGKMISMLRTGADVALAMANKAAVLAAHPEGQRRFYRFREDYYSNCNLYAFAGPKALSAAETFRGGGQFAKKPLRLLMAVGPINVALMACGRLSLRGALARLGRRLRLRIEPVILADGSHAIDVDNERTYRIASLLLERRAVRQAA